VARPVTSNDLLDLAFVSEPQISPDGERAAVVVTRIVRPTGKDGEDAAPRYRSRIELYPTRGRGRPAPLELTRSEHADRSPRFAPDAGRLAFLSVREAQGKPQLYVIGLAGGEAERLTDHAAGVDGFAWHPSGERLAYLSRGEWKDRAAEKGEPRRIVKQHWRAEGVGLLPSEPPQVYLLELRSGKRRRLTDLTEPATELAFSPDGRTLYVQAATAEADQATSRVEPRADLLALDLDSGELTTLLAGVLGLGAATPSPDGTRLAYAAASDQQDFVSPTGVWVLELERTDAGVRAAGAPRLVSGDLEVENSAGGDSRYGAYPARHAWLGSDALLALVNREGATSLVRIGLDGTVEAVQEHAARVVSAFHAVVPTPGAEPTVAFLAETPTEPGELWLRRDGRERRLSGANDAWRRRLELVAPQGPFEAGPARVPFWVLEPARPREDRAAVVQVHGGPHTNYGYGFNLEFQLLAARGYAVVFGNPRGSSSYGFTFATAMLGAYGSVDADDVMAMTEAGLERLGREGAPVHLTGGSYGGFMTNWLVGQTDRFRSAVTQRSISNWTSMYGTSDIGPFFVERQLGGVPWGDAEALWRQSPIRYADRVTTPLLIVHSEEDHRCPIEQAEQLYAVLKRLGRAETEFLRVPGEGHELSRSGRPDRRLARLEAIVDWFERHP